MKDNIIESEICGHLDVIIEDDKESSIKKINIPQITRREHNVGLQIIKIACQHSFGMDGLRKIHELGIYLLKFLELDASPYNQRDACLIFRMFHSHLPETIRSKCYDAIVHLWTFSKQNIIHSVSADIIRDMKGNDRMILFCASESIPITPLHKKIVLENRVAKLQIVNRFVWLIPIYKEDGNITHFTSDDPMDAICSFPPHNLLSSTVCKVFSKIPRLVIPYLRRNKSMSGLGCTCTNIATFGPSSRTIKSDQDNEDQNDEKEREKSIFNYFFKNIKKKNYENMSQSESVMMQENNMDAHLNIYILFTIYGFDDEIRKGNDNYIIQLRNALSDYYEGFIKKVKVSWTE